MAEPDFHLDAVQRWMQAVITHPDGVAAGLDSAIARQHLDVPPEEVESVVSRSQALTSVERLSIYANAYYARLLECLGEEFPVLKQTLGEETFDAFAFGYLQTYPSRSYTLGKLGENFARFLAETRPEGDTADETRTLAESDVKEDETETPEELPPEWPDFLIDLATMEWTFSQVFDGRGVEGQPLLSAEQLRDIDPEVWMNARLETVRCLRLLSLNFPLNDYYTAMRRNSSSPSPSTGEGRGEGDERRSAQPPLTPIPSPAGGEGSRSPSLLTGEGRGEGDDETPSLPASISRPSIPHAPQAEGDDEKPSLPAPAKSWLAVTRRDYIVRRHDLSERQYVLLSALQSGQPIGRAIESVVERFPDLDLAQFANDLGEWFRKWAAEGFFQRVLLAGHGAEPTS
jgi:hypothetical protein